MDENGNLKANEVAEDYEMCVVEFPLFSVAKIENIKNRPGCWNSVKIGLYQQDSRISEKKLIGTFDRNYSTNFDNFAYCKKDGRYFALFSPDYTATRVMEILPNEGFKDIGGEEKDGSGFCPTGYYIPQVTDLIFEANSTDWTNKLSKYPVGTRFVSLGMKEDEEKIQYEDGQYVRAYTDVNHPDRYSWVWGPKKQYESGWIIYPPDFGLISGCYWGDDSSWKVQYLDLTQIEKGIIKREEKFGYIELPENLSLKKAVDAEDCQHVTGIGGRTIKIAVSLHFDLDTGNCYVQDKNLYDRIVAGYAHSDKFMEREWSGRWKENDAEMKKRWEERHAEFEHLLK